MLFTRSRTSLYFFLLLIAGALVLNITMVGPYLLAVGMGALLTLIANPIYEFLRKRKLGPMTSATTAVTTVTVVLVVPLSIFLIEATKQALAAAKWISETQNISYPKILSTVGSWKYVQYFVGDTQALQEKITASLQRGVEAISTLLLGLLGAMPEAALQLAIAIITCWFLLIDGKKFLSWVRSLLPLDPDIRDKVGSSIRSTAISTIWATLVGGVVQAAIMGIGFLVLGVKGAFLAAGATFVMAWLPVIGSTPIWLGGTIYLYMQDSIWKAVVMLAIGLFAGISDNLVRPLVLKGQGDMHTLVALVSLIGGIHLFGVWGVFVGPIITAFLITLLQLWPRVARHFGLFRGTTAATTPSLQIHPNVEKGSEDRTLLP